MRKLRKRESYALLRAIDNALNTIKRSPLRYAHRDDEDTRGISQGIKNIPCRLFCLTLFTLSYVLFSDAQAQSAGERADEGFGAKMVAKLAGQQEKGTYLLSGQVKAIYSDAPLEGVSIRVVSTREITFTDQEGRFDLKTNTADGILEISYPEFSNLKVTFSDGQLSPTKNRFYLEKDTSHIQKLTIGDKLPESLWTMPLEVVNHPEGRNSISLNEYRGKRLIVLDIWSTYCSPCIRTITHWEKQMSAMGHDLVYLTVLTDYKHKAKSFLQAREWQAPCLVGDDVWKLHAHFFDRLNLGALILILDGRIYAIPKDKALMPSDIQKILKAEWKKEDRS
jgi:thiol-disulfide isomerase/thioredoxin